MSQAANQGCFSRQANGGRRAVTLTPQRHPSSSGLSKRNQRSLPSTPEMSSTQRELKKLEDYWTRNNPIKEDSPRLRSSTKVSFDIKDFKTERNISKPPKYSVKIQSVNDNDLKSLPESSIPINQVFSQTVDNHVRAKFSESLDKKNRYSNEVDVVSDAYENFKKDRLSALSHDHKLELDKNRIFRHEHTELNGKNEAKQSVTCINSSDSDGDDYIPPRKKLRSEVREEELWEGIPLTISFKRLAPIPKVSAATRVNASAQYLLDNEFKKKVERETSMARNDVENINMLTKTFKDDSPSNKEISYLERTSESGIRRKRCRCLKEKLAGTQSKIDSSNALSKDPSPVVRITRINFPFELNKDSLKAQCDNDTECGSKIDPGETILYANKEETETNDNKTNKDCDGDRLLTLTLSQILSVDNKNDVSLDEISNKESDRNEENDNTEAEIRNKITSTTVLTPSFCETVNDIFAEISGPDYLQIDKSDGNGVACIDSVKQNGLRIKRRRSRKLSDIEQKSIDQNSPKHEYSKDRQVPETVSCAQISGGESSSNMFEKESITNLSGITVHSSKHKLFTKKPNKCAKTVPPLKIKLQPSANNKQNDIGESKSRMKSESTNKKKVGQEDKREHRVVITNANPCTSKVSPLDYTDKEVITPKSKKKKESKQRKWSPPPPSTITLRLNSERRLSAAGSLLSNPLLNRHACVLWSSENRRHMQLSNPNATMHELDAKLSRKWDSLSEKEKLRYFQRARDAIRDENRHSNRRVRSNLFCFSIFQGQKYSASSESDPNKKYTDECSVENFQKLSPVIQMSEIKKWLNFYNEVSPESCSLVIRSFKETLVEDNKNKSQNEKVQEKSKAKSKKNKQKKKDEQVMTMDNNAYYRKLLFKKIQDQKDNIKELLTLKKKEQCSSVLESYNSMIKRMISGDGYQFTGDVSSDRLTETLLELRALEKENKLDVTGKAVQGVEEYQDILERLYCWNSPDGKSLVGALDNADVDVIEMENKCKKIIKFPSLSPKSVTNNLPDIRTLEKSEVNLFSPLSTGRLNRKSPVSVLTEMVADDITRQQPQIGFRNAISLLSNKIVPSPTILHPGGRNIDKSAGNRNRNCDVVFTKLQNSKSSVVSTKVDLLN